MKKTNPDCKVEREILHENRGPDVIVNFIDGRKLEWLDAKFIELETLRLIDWLCLFVDLKYMKIHYLENL